MIKLGLDDCCLSPCEGLGTVASARAPGGWENRLHFHRSEPVSSPVHQNYIGNDAEKSPFFLSVTLSDQNNQRVPQYRAILWRKTVSSCPGVSPPPAPCAVRPLFMSTSV